MIDVTDKAAAILDETLKASRQQDSDVFRLIRSGEGLGLAISEEREHDQVIECDDRRVLVIEPEISQALDGATIDAVQTPEGPRLTIRSPEGP